jgi:hypothetical protein
MDTKRRNRLMELFRAHTGAEAVGDLDGVMATISPNTIYEWYPFGYRITDWNTIKEYYELCFAEYHLDKGTVTFGLSASFGDQDVPEDLYWWGEKNSMIARDDLFGLDADGVKRSMKHYTVWTLDPETDLLHGETVMTSKFGGEMFIPILDKLANRPGFSRIVV